MEETGLVASNVRIREPLKIPCRPQLYIYVSKMWGDVTKLEVKSVVRTIGIVISLLVYYNVEFLYISTK